MAMVSILGLYNVDGTIFDNMVYPNSFSTDDFETVKDSILFDCAELEILYPDPAVIKLAIEKWSKAELPSWNRYANALEQEYNPLWNVDADISETVTRTGESTQGGEDSETLNSNTARQGTATNTETDNLNTTSEFSKSIEGSGVDELSSTAFNVAQYRLRDKTEGTSATSETGDESITKTGTVTNANTWSDGSETDDTKTIEYGKTEQTSGSESRTVRRTGNIGVTSSQQLIESEIQLAKYNITRLIVDSFKTKFCILVY